MMALVLFLLFVVLMFIGVPIAFSLGISSFVYLIVAGIPLTIIPQKMYSGIDSFVLLCIPGFVLAGNLMNQGGITQRIVDFSNAMIGHIRGGLGLVAVLACMIFAGISGTAVAEVASIGALLIPAMISSGYGKKFSCGLVASAATVGPIIPPSVPMIIVGSLTGLSVSKMFAAGAIPGILIGLSLMIAVYVISKKRNYPKTERVSLKELFNTFKSAIWAILMTVLILYGILGGMFTPTEAAIIAVVYGLLIGFFIYKELKIKNLPKIIIESMISSAAIMILVGFANLFAWILASEQIPQLVVNTILGISSNKFIILLLVNIFLLFVGCFMETISALIILFPILLKLVMGVGVEPIHFAVIAVLNLVIGLSTPPLGICLFVSQSIGKISLMDVIKGVLPFLIINLIILMLVSYIPDISLALPKLLYGNW